MTIPTERYRALKNIPEVLFDLSMRTDRITKKEMRETFRRILKHYPTNFDIDELARKCPSLLRKE